MCMYRFCSLSNLIENSLNSLIVNRKVLSFISWIDFAKNFLKMFDKLPLIFHL